MWENKNNLIRFTLQPYKKDGMQVQKDKSVPDFSTFSQLNKR